MLGVNSSAPNVLSGTGSNIGSSGSLAAMMGSSCNFNVSGVVEQQRILPTQINAPAHLPTITATGPSATMNASPQSTVNNTNALNMNSAFTSSNVGGGTATGTLTQPDSPMEITMSKE